MKSLGSRVLGFGFWVHKFRDKVKVKTSKTPLFLPSLCGITADDAVSIPGISQGTYRYLS